MTRLGRRGWGHEVGETRLGFLNALSLFGCRIKHEFLIWKYKMRRKYAIEIILTLQVL